jgi:YbbR domain-containing protein
MWVFVINETPPMVVNTFVTNLEVRELENITNQGLIALNIEELENTEIAVQVRATKQNMSRLQRSINNLTTHIIVSPIENVQNNTIYSRNNQSVVLTMPPELNPNHFEIVSITPSFVNIVIDDYITREHRVALHTQGSLEEGFLPLAPTTSPASIEISGAMSVLDSISAVQVKVDIDGATEEVRRVGEVFVTNIYGEDITNYVSVSHEEVEVVLPILRRGEVEVREPVLIGTLPEGYVIVGVHYSPKTIHVIGEIKDVANLTEIVISPIDLNYEAGAFYTTINLEEYVNSYNLSIQNGTPHEITVFIDIDTIETRELIMPIYNIINVGAYKDFAYEQSYLSLNVRGAQKHIDEFATSEITGLINLTDVSEGVYEAQVLVELDNTELTVVNSPSILVTVTSSNEPEYTEPDYIEQEHTQPEYIEPDYIEEDIQNIDIEENQLLFRNKDVNITNISSTMANNNWLIQASKLQ